MKLPTLNRKMFLLLFILILLITIVFRIYKAHNTGVVYDEAWSYGYFGNNIEKMLSPQPEPHQNYHVLTTILNCYSHKYFGGYEHFIRIPHLISGIIFSLSLAYIIYKAVKSNALRVVLLAAASLQYFVFDLSFLARGYALGLGAVYAGIAFIIWLIGNKIRYKNLWIPVIVISFMNFLAIGSMVSTMWMLFAINVVFVLLYSPKVFTNLQNKRNPVILNLFFIGLLSFLSLYVLYKDIYREILFASGRYTATHRPDPFFSYMKQLLVDMFINYESKFSVALFWAFALLIGFSFILLIYKLSNKIKNGTFRLRLNHVDCRIFIVLVTLITISAMFVHRTILNMSIGYRRNGVFLVPLVLIGVAVLFESAWRAFKNKILSRIVQISAVIIILLLTLQNLPSTCVVEAVPFDWEMHSVSGPLLRRLKQIDPDRIWQITLTRKMRFVYMPLQYYAQFGYKFTFTRPKNCDVLVFYKDDKIKANSYLDKDYFRNFKCFVAIGPQFGRNRISPGFKSQTKNRQAF